MLSATLLFVLRVADWNAVQGYVNWGVLIMYGGAVALGRAITETRAMEWVFSQALDATMPSLLVVMILATAAIMLTEGISNSAAVAILLPIGYSVGEMTGVGPAMMTLAVTIPAGLAFLLPVGSPPNAISFAAGHYSIREVVQVGWPLNVCGLLLLFATIVLWWGPVLNVNAW
jgi:sodium-dependent dicarboxylate transporter 2/3/5